jgi:hypothetical protein
MIRTYFELLDDLDWEGRWYLNRLCDCAGTELDSREFRYGRALNLGPPIKAKAWKTGIPVEAQPPLRVLLDPKREGEPLDFTFTNEDMPVVTSRVGAILASIAGGDIQRIPVLVEAREEPYEILNVVRVIDCIDTKRSEIQWFEPGNNVRPDLAGKPEMVTKLVVDPALVGEHHMFRIEGWEIVIVVSDVIRDAFERARVSGVGFRRVST